MEEKIYFIRFGEGLIKCGRTHSLPTRLRQLQATSAVKLHLLGSIPGGLSREKEIHKLWHHLRRGGEFFEPAPDFLRWIDQQLHPEPDPEAKRRWAEAGEWVRGYFQE